MESGKEVAQATLQQLRAQILSGDSVTGAVAVSAVTAALAVTVLEMSLEVTARKHPSEHVDRLIESAREVSVRLLACADEDRAAYTAYRQARKDPAAAHDALRRAIETPLAAARAAASAIPLCGEASGLAHGPISADVGGAALLLSGAVRAMLLSVDANLKAMHDPLLSQHVARECSELREHALLGAEHVLRQLGVSIANFS
jgi:formiminotetrahydrofolate cyclodeaminase